MYDYLIVGSGLYGSICAYELNKKGYKCLVIDKRANIAGNIYTENIDGINVGIQIDLKIIRMNHRIQKYAHLFSVVVCNIRINGKRDRRIHILRVR